MIHSDSPRFIDLPMPRLRFDKNAKNYVAIYDVVTAEHSLFNCDADDLADPVATMTRFNQRAAAQVGLDRRDIARDVLAKVHHDFVALPFHNEAMCDQVRGLTFILTEVEQHPWLFVVRAPQGTRLFRVPVKTAKQFHTWVYSEGKQLVLDIANELVARDPEGFAEFAAENGHMVALH